MSLDQTGYLKETNKERLRLHDATIKKVEVTSKPQEDKLCNSCRQSMMTPYLQPPSKLIDVDGYDNTGSRPNTWYWICHKCWNKEEMPTLQENSKRGYKTKNSVVPKMPMYLGTYDRINQSWSGRKRRSTLMTREEQDDLDSLSSMLGYTPESVSVANSDSGDAL
jgi:hypothetical protein